MSKEEPEITSSRIIARSTIIVAIIGLIGIVATAILDPLGQKWINQPTPTSTSTFYPIENFPQQDFPYFGDETSTGKSGVAALYVLYDGSNQFPRYLLDYNVPQEPSGYAGLSFQFTNGQNVANYNAIEFTIQFSDTNIPIDFYAKDITGQSSSIRILSSSTDKMNIRYALDDFSGIDFNALKEVGFNSDNTFSTGRHTITVSDIRFVH